MSVVTAILLSRVKSLSDIAVQSNFVITSKKLRGGWIAQLAKA